MYNFIIDYFEAPREGTPQRELVDGLLAWWNQCVSRSSFRCLYLTTVIVCRQIFPSHASSASTSRAAVNSMAKLRAQQSRTASSP
jgi:hypothetical protein